MKISEFRIFRYGPLKDTGPIEPDNFTILWGNNEKGKTLIVDALLKMILKNEHGIFSRIDRVSEFPEGYLIINYRGKDYKLPQDNSLSKVVSAADFRNIFVIRDSDLTISEESQYYSDVTRKLIGSRVGEIGKIIQNLNAIGKVTDRGEFSNRANDYKLKERITKANALSQEIRGLIGKLQKENFEELEIQLIRKKKELETVKNELELLRMAAKKEKYLKALELISTLEEAIHKLEEYKKYDPDDVKKWIQLNNDLTNLEITLQKRKDELEQISDSYRVLLEEKSRIEKSVKEAEERKNLAEQLKDAINEKQRLDRQYESECSAVLKRLEKELESKLEQKRDIDTACKFVEQNNIKVRIENLKKAAQDLEVSQKVRRLLETLMISTFITGMVAIVAGSVLKSTSITAVGIGFGLFGVVLGILRYRRIIAGHTKDSWEALIKDVTPVFENIELRPDNIEYHIKALENRRRDIDVEVSAAKKVYETTLDKCQELTAKAKETNNKIKRIVGQLKIQPKDDLNLYFSDIKEVQGQHEGLVGYYREVCGKLEEMERQKKNLEGIISELNENIDSTHKEVEGLRHKYGLKSLEELQAKVEERNKIESELSKIRESLRTLFGYRNSNLKHEIDIWKSKLKELEKYKDNQVSRKYDEALEQELSKKTNELESEIQKLQSKIAVYQDSFKDIALRAQKILVSADPEVILSPLSSEDEVVCSGISDLERICDLLEKFIHNNEKRRRYVQVAKQILDDIKKEEEKKITELFGEASSAIKYFERITDGLYQNIIYDSESHGIKVTRSDGLELSANQLSGGAWDQLYFAVRLSLAEKILDEKGFFILDDPFIKADPERLKSLFDILKDLSDEGWQIIYLSSKGEIKEIYERYYKDAAKYVSINYL